MSKRVRVNILSRANTSAVRKEKRSNGRDVLVVPSATLPDDVIMNGIKYPADEIEKSFATLNRTPAPFGHPTINGQFVSASDPEGINVGYIGAWNENVRRESGRVLLDKVIDIEVANRTDDGKAVLAAINAGDPVHTSTGLFCLLDASNGADGYENIAREIHFDHDAILLNEDGAATPEQGVGMMVNKATDKDGSEIQVINSAIEWADRDLDWAVSSVVDALDRRQKAGLVDRIKSALIEAFGSGRETPQNNESEDDMAVTDEQFKALSETVNAQSETMKGLPDLIANAIKPLVEANAEMQANAKAKDDAELAGHIATIIKANILDEDGAKELTLNSARKLAEKAAPGKAAALNAAPDIGSEDEFEGLNLNTALEAK